MGAVRYNVGTHRFNVNFEKIQDAVASLTHCILVLQGDGDIAAAEAFVDRWAKLGPEALSVLNGIREERIPIDVRPHYPIEKELELEE